MLDISFFSSFTGRSHKVWTDLELKGLRSIPQWLSRKRERLVEEQLGAPSCYHDGQSWDRGGQGGVSGRSLCVERLN